MRILVTFLSMLFVAGILFDTQSENLNYFTKWKFTVEGNQLIVCQKEKVKNRKSYSAYYLKDEKLPEKISLVEEVIFNKTGLIKQKNYYNFFEEIREMYIYTYDKKNRLITEEALDQYDNITFKKEYKYNTHNDTTEIKITERKRNNSGRKIFKYDVNSRITEKIHFDADDEAFLTEKYIYKENELSAIEFYNPLGSKIDQIDFVYNTFGNLAEEIKSSTKKIYYYDGQNRKIKTTEGSYINLYKFDDNGQVVDDQFFINSNRRQFRLGLNYFKNGLLKEVIRYESDDKKAFYTKYEYEFYK